MSFKKFLPGLLATLLATTGILVLFLAPNAGADLNSRIQITSTTATSYSNECVSWDDVAWRGLASVSHRYDGQDRNQFVMSIRLTHDLCEAKIATAAVYLMPNSGWPWPQQLIEKSDFSISLAGTYEVHFSRGCDLMQYDIVQGYTPEVLNAGWEHTLLLGNSAFQDFEQVACNQLEEGTTTVVPEATTTTTTTTTTEAVAAVSTIVDSTTTTIPVEISATSQVRELTAPAPVAEVKQLAYTGNSGNTVMFFLALALISVGGYSVYFAKRRLA